jgi:hypothetical protein
MRARGAGHYDRQAARQPVDTHVQEAAENQPENEDYGCDDEFHQTLTR